MVDDAKYFLNPSIDEEVYINLVNMALAKKDKIAKMQNKENLLVLQMIFYIYRRKFDSNSVLEILEMIEHPKNMTSSMRRFLEKVPFTKEQLTKCDTDILKNFEYNNRWIENICSSKAKININELKYSSQILKKIENLSKS